MQNLPYIALIAALIIQSGCGIQKSRHGEIDKNKKLDNEIPLPGKLPNNIPPSSSPTSDIADKYKTIDDLLEAIQKGETITKDIAKKFADKQASNSITNEQICKIAKTKKVTEDILLALAEKATIRLDDSKSNLCDLPEKVLSKMIDNMPDNSIKGIYLRFLMKKQEYNSKNVIKFCKKAEFEYLDIAELFYRKDIIQELSKEKEAVKILIGKIPDNSINEKLVNSNIMNILEIYQNSNVDKHIREILFKKIEYINSDTIELILNAKNLKYTEEEIENIFNKKKFPDWYGKKLEKEINKLNSLLIKAGYKFQLKNENENKSEL
jgi:hypothetical protein